MAAVGLVTAVVAGVVLAFLLRAADVREAHRRGETLAAAAAVLADASRAGGRSFGVIDHLRDAVPGVYAIAVIATDGRALWPPGTATPAPAGALSAERDVPGVGKVVVTYAPPGAGPWVTFALAAGVPLVLLLVLAAAFTWSVRRNVLRPIAALEENIGKSLTGDFMKRVSLPDGARIAEVDALLRTFNRLLAKITDLHVSAIDTGRELDETRRELQLKKALAEQKRVAEAANALLEARVRELSLLFEVSRVISATGNLDEVLRSIAILVGQRLGLEEITLMALDDARRRLVVRAAHGFEGTAIRTFSLGVDEGVAGQAARTGETQICGDVASDGRFVPFPGAPATGSLLCVPARFRGEIIGVINFGRAGKNAFRPEDILYLSTIAEQCAVALGNAQLWETAAATAIPVPRTSAPG